MSAGQQLRDSGLFRERDHQEDGDICFQLLDVAGGVAYGASIYVQPNDAEVDIRVRALEAGRFPEQRPFASLRPVVVSPSSTQPDQFVSRLPSGSSTSSSSA